MAFEQAIYGCGDRHTQYLSMRCTDRRRHCRPQGTGGRY